ncbi:MAG: SPFH domain-containing protein [Patescibacteria group bacterium]|nr:SPFH domain-containing protein [Patescibacteria group bacterium]
MKKNEKVLHSWLKEMARDQILIIGIWLSVVLLLLLVAGAFLNFILGKIITSITSSSIGVVILENAWWVILIICIGIFISHARKTIYKSRVIIKERNVALLECFGEFIGEDDDTIENSRGVIREGLHFVFPYFNIFKIHNDITYYLGDMRIELFKKVNKDDQYPIDVKGTSVNLIAKIKIAIENPIAAAYKIRDYQGEVVDKCEAALRKSCAKWSLDELLEEKKGLNLLSILSEYKSGEEQDVFEDFKKYGIDVLELTIIDIEVQKKDSEQREKVFAEESEKRAEIVRLEKEKIIADKNQEITEVKTKTEADRKIALAEAEGQAFAKHLKESSLTIEQYLALENIKRLQGTTTVITDSEGFVNFGAKLAVGAHAVNQNQKEKEA